MPSYARKKLITSEERDLAQDQPDLDHFSFALSLVTPTIRECALKVPKEYLEMEDAEIEELVQPTKTDRMLRISFWNEIDRLKRGASQNSAYNSTRVWSGICTRQYFYDKFLRNTKKIAFLFHPPTQYNDRALEMIDFGLGRLREALGAKIVYPNGHLDPKATKVILDIVQYFDARMKGTLKQQVAIESKNQTTNVEVNLTGNLEDLDKQLQNLRQQISLHQGNQLTQGIPERIVDVKGTSTDSD